MLGDQPISVSKAPKKGDDYLGLDLDEAMSDPLTAGDWLVIAGICLIPVLIGVVIGAWVW